MKHKFLFSLIAAIGLTTTTVGVVDEVKPSTVQAVNLNKWKTPKKVKLTKNVSIWKEKMAKYHYQVKIVGKKKKLKKGTTLKLLPGGMGFNWFVIKKGYTHSGLKISKHNFKIKTTGYVWAVQKRYTDQKWFKIIK